MAEVEFFVGSVGPFLVDDADPLYSEPNQVALKKDLGVLGDTVVSETAFGQSATAGVSSEVSRKDHTHGTPSLPFIILTSPGTSIDATALVQDALDNFLFVFILGWFKITSALTLRAGQRIVGKNVLESGFIKTDYNGSVLLGVDTDWVYLESFGIDGPGQWTGTGNKGIDLHVSSQEIFTNLTVRNVHMRYLNDISLYAGTGAFCTYDQVKIFQGGYAGIYIDGGDGHFLSACSVRDIILGINLNGPTTVDIGATYVEQAGLGFLLNGANSVCLRACGVEANINRDATYPGRSFQVTGGEGNSIISALSRQDTLGAAADSAAQHLLVNGNASHVTVSSFRKVNHATYIPTTEVDVSGALNTVVFNQHNFDPTKITSGGMFGNVDFTVI